MARLRSERAVLKRLIHAAEVYLRRAEIRLSPFVASEKHIAARLDLGGALEEAKKRVDPRY